MSTKRFFDMVRPLFGGSISNDQFHSLTAILEEAKRRRVGRQPLAYILATVHHETGRTMRPVREAFAASDDEAIRRLESAWRAGKLSWVKTPYWRRQSNGHAYYGRGFVQITHADNYRRLGQLLGIDLVNDPDRALDFTVALDILFEGMLRGLFTGRSLDDVSEPATSSPNFVNDRVVVNGKDRAQQIARHADVYYEALADVDLLEYSRTIDSVKKQNSAANAGIITGAAGAIGTGATAIIDALGNPDTAVDAVNAATTLSQVLPVAAGVLSFVAILALIVVKVKAKKIEEARRDDAEKGKR